MGHLPKWRRAEQGGVPLPFRADLRLGRCCDIHRGFEKAPDQGLLLGFEPARADFVWLRRNLPGPGLLQQQGPDRDGTRRVTPGDAGLALRRLMVLRLGGDQRMWHQLAVDDQIGEEGCVHVSHSAGVGATLPPDLVVVAREIAALFRAGSALRRRERTIW